MRRHIGLARPFLLESNKTTQVDTLLIFELLWTSFGKAACEHDWNYQRWAGANRFTSLINTIARPRTPNY